MDQPIYSSFDEINEIVINLLYKTYWKPLYAYLLENPELIKTIPGFLVNPQEIILYYGKTHLGIEYIGPERLKSLSEIVGVNVRSFDYTESKDNFIEQIIGFRYSDTSSKLSLPLLGVLEDLIMPTNKGFDKLAELNWHFEAQESMTVFNSSSLELLKSKFSRIINGLFFDADENGLRTRHIKWMDFVPVQYDNTDAEKDVYAFNFSTLENLVERDARYSYPLPSDYDYRHSKLQKINRLIELVGNRETKETDITQLLSDPDYHFILTMRFGAVSIFPEVTCQWQSVKKEAIRPDFFIVNTNGFADIVEFKLPTTELGIVGRENRETFSYKLNSYISQTRVYRSYFDDSSNRIWFEQNYHYKVYRPRRILVIGRRWQFDLDTWREIVSDHQDLEILTYDDLVDGVVAQLYM